MILLKKKKNDRFPSVIHFIGIGGIGMSGIAEVMHNLGYAVQGSDAVKGNNTERLIERGIEVFYGHDIKNLKDVSYVVVSSAISEDNPEITAAIELKIPVITRAMMLAELMRLKCSIAVSGAHGKTTTTALIAYLFESNGIYPTVINGGVINTKKTNAYLGLSDYLVAEADESDATFIKIPSTIGVITNIDREHMNFYSSFENIIDAFKNFITNLPFYGFCVACIDDDIVRKLTELVTERKIITYGIDSHDAHVKAYDISFSRNGSTFNLVAKLPCMHGEIRINNILIPLPGRHNVLNALAAISIGIELEFSIKVIQSGFKGFCGVKRRFSKIINYNGADIIDDYAHHPTEIAATIASAKNMKKDDNSKIVVIFQPHRYSRVSDLFDDFVSCFDQVDKLFITDIYSAGEENKYAISSHLLINAIKNRGKNVEFLDNPEKNIRKIIEQYAKSGDFFLLMGAGNITKWANALSDMND